MYFLKTQWVLFKNQTMNFCFSQKLHIKTLFSYTKPTDQTIFKAHILYYPTPINFNYIQSFGSLAGLFFTIQLVSGILLAMHYTPHVLFAFDSVEHIMRDLNFGQLLRYLHANGASFFFIMVYVDLIVNL